MQAGLFLCGKHDGSHVPVHDAEEPQAVLVQVVGGAEAEHQLEHQVEKEELEHPVHDVEEVEPPPGGWDGGGGALEHVLPCALREWRVVSVSQNQSGALSVFLNFFNNKK